MVDIKDVELKIIKNYGVIPQLKHFQSEVFELTEAIINHELKESVEYEIPLTEIIGTKKHVIEEIADVQLMLNQFKNYYEIKDYEILTVMLYKANRQLKRMEEEKGNSNE